ncbi:MAG: inorganic phosphate transporter [Flavonifractor plautii]
MSTTHAKTAAILGAGSAGGGTVNHRVAARIALTWLFTFPGCGLLGFLLASLFRSPPLLWYTDARYDFLTFDTGGSNHVPLRHSHL